MKKFLIIVSLLFLIKSTSLADTPYFLDFKLILNESISGKKAQSFLKQKLETGFKNISEKEKKILEEEKKIIQQKKIISNEEYKKKVSELRKKVSSLQKERNELLQSVGKQRSEAKKTLLKNLNPIVKDYMEEKKIRVVLDKKTILLADETLDITKDIIDLLNKKLKTIKLN
jgi:outer membrane protein